MKIATDHVFPTPEWTLQIEEQICFQRPMESKCLIINEVTSFYRRAEVLISYRSPVFGQSQKSPGSYERNRPETMGYVPLNLSGTEHPFSGGFVGRQLNKTVAGILRVPLEIIGFVFGTAYKILFAKADVALSKRREIELEADVKRDLAFLFGDNGARIVPDESVRYPRPFDYAVVTVAIGDLLLRFTRGRGELRVQVRSNTSAGWSELSDVLRTVGIPISSDGGLITSFHDVARTLAPSLTVIMDAFSEDRRAETEQELSNIRNHERVIAKQWETEINRRLYN